jgi:uncharacterized membrane protein
MTTPSTFPGVRPSRRPAIRFPAAETVFKRVQSVDLLRGLVMVIMALDHVRDYFSRSHFDPSDLTQTTAALFATRWITHYCAPVFILLAGVSAWMAGRRRTRAELSFLLLTRGLWLILLEVTVVSFGWYFNFRFEHGASLQVIWAIGISMIVLAGLVWLPRGAISLIAIGLIAGHNLLDPLDAQFAGSPLWSMLHAPHELTGLHLLLRYPVLPWIGVMAAGFALGPVLERPQAERNRALIVLGLGAIAAFIFLRAVGVYGDPSPWVRYDDPVTTVLSFFKVTKYPPSLEYLLMTLGPALIVLVLLERLSGRVAEWLETFGTAPFFYYIVHLYLIHGLAILTGMATGFGAAAIAHLSRDLPAEYGFSLPVVYLIWAGVLITLYRPTKWFGAMKAKRKEWWWAYL